MKERKWKLTNEDIDRLKKMAEKNCAENGEPDLLEEHIFYIAAMQAEELNRRVAKLDAALQSGSSEVLDNEVRKPAIETASINELLTWCTNTKDEEQIESVLKGILERISKEKNSQ